MPYKDKLDRKKFDERRRLKQKKFFVEYLNTHPCVDCGNSDVKEFLGNSTHIDMLNLLLFAVAALGDTKKSFKGNRKNVKFVVLNCHKIRHFMVREPKWCGESL